MYFSATFINYNKTDKLFIGIMYMYYYNIIV